MGEGETRKMKTVMQVSIAVALAGMSMAAEPLTRETWPSGAMRGHSVL